MIGFSGLLPIKPVRQEGDRPPVLLVHGKNDRTIPPIASKAAAEELRSFGFEVELVIEPEVGHTISMSGATKALQFLQRKFGV